MLLNFGGGDPERIKRLLWQIALARGKWETHPTCLDRAVANAASMPRLDGQVVKVVELNPNSTPVVRLERLRDKLSDARAARLHKPGFSPDRSQSGVGKTHACLYAMSQTESGLICAPTHVAAREVVEQLGEVVGADRVGVAPELTQENCRQFDEAKLIQSPGLPFESSLCGQCSTKSWRQGQGYQALKLGAMHRPYLTATTERLGLNPELAMDRDYVAIHESVFDAFVRPTTINFAQLEDVRSTLSHARFQVDQWVASAGKSQVSSLEKL